MGILLIFVDNNCKSEEEEEEEEEEDGSSVTLFAGREILSWGILSLPLTTL